MRSTALGCLALCAACAPADPQAFWTALSTADPAAARAAAATDAQRRCADALEATLAGGSAAGAAQLLALGADPDAGAARDWARRLLLHLLRVEGEWQRLAHLHHDHPELALTEDAVPAGMRELPRAAIAPPDAPLQLPWLPHDSGLAVVEAHLGGLDGTATVQVALDTGAALCSVTAAVAERLGVRMLGDAPLPVLGFAGQTANGRAGVLPELSLGAWVLRDLPVAVVPSLRVTDTELSALVGWDVLQHVLLELRPRERSIVVARSQGRAPDADPNLVLLTEPLLRLQCGENGVLLLLDTGSTTTDVTRELTARLGLPTRRGGSQTFQGVGGTIEVDIDLVALPLRCGKTQFTLGNVTAYDRPPVPPGLPRIDGGLGMDVLGTVRVVVDGPARTVALHAQ